MLCLFELFGAAVGVFFDHADGGGGEGASREEGGLDALHAGCAEEVECAGGHFCVVVVGCGFGKLRGGVSLVWVRGKCEIRTAQKCGS